MNHSVLVAGYNTQGAQPYWIVKNSWGASWGQSGYIWILISTGNGICGINLDPTYPTL